MQASEQVADQTTVQARRPNGTWRSGVSGNPAGCRVHDLQRQTLQAQIEAELGGQVSPADKLLLQRAVELLSKRAKSHVDTVRGTNLAHRILQSLRAKYAAEAEQTTPDLQELLSE